MQFVREGLTFLKACCKPMKTAASSSSAEPVFLTPQACQDFTA